MENTPEQIAWLAGLIEGEGSFDVKGTKIVVGMTDEDVIRQLHEWFGGYVNGPYNTNGGKKPVWKWTVAQQRDVLDLSKAIRPWMKSRRSEKLDRLIAYLETKGELPVNGVYVRTDEMRQKLRERRTGYVCSPETRKKMSEAAKQRWTSARNVDQQ